MIVDRIDIQNIYPLTPLQEGLFFHAESEQESEAYVEQWCLRICGELRADLVRAVWSDLVARHEVFRSIFTLGDGKRPLQIVLRERGVEIATKDFSALPPAEQAAALAAERERDRARGFRLAIDPLARILLIRLGANEWEIVWSHHHIILDGWSVVLVQAEFMRLYAARRAGRALTLAPAQPFSRFVRSIPATTDTAFWRAYLADAAPAAELPRARMPGRSAIAREFVAFTPATTTKLDAFCRGEGVTLGAFVQAVWGIVLGRYAGAADVVFGWVVSGRPADLPGVEGMVGLFINTLPIRIRLYADEDETFRGFVARVHRGAAELLAHQHTPLAEIQRAAGASPLFSHVVAVENYPVADAVASAAETGFEVRSSTSYDRTHYGFELVVLPSPDGLRLRLSWNRANHDDDAMIRLGAQLAHVVETVLHEPDVRPSRINILPSDQWEAVVRVPNRTAAAYPEATIVELFDAQVRANPAAPAIIEPHGERWLTYGELERRADALAAHLVHDLHIAAGSRIALCASPSVDAIVGILGILKAGATYVPIDPRYPTERVRFLLEDARPAAVLTSGADASALPALAVPIVEIGAHVADQRPLPSRAKPDDLAYVIYTSGSTGKPKGCLVTHRNVVRLIANDRLPFDFGPADTWIVAHSLSFDFSVWELFAPLLHGARVVVPSRETVQDVPAFRELLVRYRVSVLNQTPLAFANLVAVEEGATHHTLDAHLRCVIFGGDRLDVGLLRRWIRHYSADRIALVNMYGITETTVHVTQRRLSDEQILVPPRESPIGVPLPETTVYVCDRHLNPQPFGAPGEMLVGGTGVCAGYLKRPELTAERFIPDVFGGGGSRLYRSGDLAYRDASGELFYLGRNDAQVKVRGHRIEPAEIERALASLPGVKRAAVVADTGSAGTELIACLVGDATPDALRAGLARHLPEYAVPSAFVACDALPLTANGKLDRAAVRALRADAAGTARAPFVAPATDRERLLAEIWAAVLGAPRIGRHDRFIDLGGDSIKSILILARLRARGLTLELRDLIKYPTIAELTPLITERRPRTAATESGASFPLTPIQRRFFEAHPVDRAHYNHALLLRCTRRCDPEGLRAALQTLSDNHSALRLRFHEDSDGTWTQRVAARGEPVAFAVVELAREPDGNAAIERLSEAQQTALHLDDGPLVRAVLFADPAGDRLLLVAHHLTVDGVSWRVILDDLRALFAGEEPLPPTDTFEQWSAALHEPALRQRIAAELPYWREADAAPPDAWRPTFAAGTYAEARETLVEWSASETADAMRACSAYQTNLGELLLAATARALGRWTGCATLHVALEGHGRDAVAACDLGRTVGWFTALYPFVLDLTDALVGRRVRALKEALRRVPSGGAGYGILRYLTPADGTPLRAEPRVSFNYLGELRNAPGEGFVLSSEPIGSAVSPRGPRPFVIEITALVVGETMRLSLTSPEDVASASVVRLSDMIREELRVVVDHCLERNAPELTPADLTHSSLSLDEFDELFDED
jgi:amino acid adenylation domain-containing protein/non-ribosomal peptide synthase protein (TIGR01720 family)